jgi:hypothetical protein
MKELSMDQSTVLSLTEYKAQLAFAAYKSNEVPREQEFPSADRLWELLDKNINLAVWVKNN